MNGQLAKGQDNTVWQRTDDNIMTALYQLLDENNNVVPTYKEIAVRAGCESDTVGKHLKGKTANDFSADFVHYMPAIIKKMITKAVSGDGDVGAAKLSAQLLGHKDSSQIEVNANVDSTLKIQFVGTDFKPNQDEIEQVELTVIDTDTDNVIEPSINELDDDRQTDN